MNTTPRTTVVGVFSERREAEHAIDDLKRSGFRDDQIGIAARDEQHPEGTVTSESDHNSGGAAATGAVTGGVLGGVLGALAAGLIPGIGPVLAGGILAGVLGGAAVGAAAGGLLGALTGMGVPEEDARYYDEEFKGGRTIVTVKADGRYDEARTILHSYGGYDVETRPDLADARGLTSTPRHDETRRPAAGRSAVESRAMEQPSGQRTMELKEEELKLNRQTVDAGKVEVEKDIETERRTLDVPVTHEEVVIERHPVDRRPVSGPLNDDDEIEVRLQEDRVTLDKQAVVYEEVEVDKRQIRDTEHVTEDVRREVARVSNEADVNVRESGARSAHSWDEVSPTYRDSWQRRYGTSGTRWEDSEPGYRYGYEMSNDERYRGRSWDEVEPEFRADYADWSRRGGYRSEASNWDSVREHAREAWESARQRTTRR